ncbi:sodium:solute symporter family protein [Tenacibaculum sp. L6]|uniref:sodium:solute symporter family protein n=1 Tax=Tenacibaculum sp. L6 TaxID=2992764 RepID=UPI00237A51CD|nr:sodium:solute symporter family protein [Tenacibaculum sp. L6]MDE0535813.1 Na+:solute symporter [Tenacibaculum sp. L6]
MNLTTIDYTFIFIFFSITLGIGIWVSKKSKQSASEYFLSGRNMPWWLLGVSMVATTFSTDTPNLITDIVRTNGVSGNWVWWAFLLTGMLTVFIYAKLWRKSQSTTDLEFYELRYGGKPAKFLRGFRSLYLGIFFNVLAMAGVTLAAIKIGEVMLGLTPIQTIGIASIVTVIFSAIGGFKGVVYTDFLLFFVAMIGAIGAAFVAVNHPEVDGLENLLTHPNVVDKLSILPDFNNKELLISIFIIPLAVQWWSAWYPGAEPGGGGYIAQRMLASKDENHAIGATFFFNILHYALRPWPWIIVALASLVVFPDLASIKEAFPNVSDDKLGHDLAYPAMLTFLPSGLAGVVLTSLVAAYMSTISTHLNWGASYIVNDFYKQNINPNANEKTLVNVGKLATVVLMIFSAILALLFTNALEIFKFILMFGAGTGLIFLLRWFWWRINAWSEISAMIASGIFSLIFYFNAEYLFGTEGVFESYWQFPLVVLFTTIVWLLVTLLTKPEDDEVLINFYKRIQPKKAGWLYVLAKAKEHNISLEEEKETVNLGNGLLAAFTGCILVFSSLFATGNWIYGNYTIAMVLTGIAFVTVYILLGLWKRIKVNFL